MMAAEGALDRNSLGRGDRSSFGGVAWEGHRSGRLQFLGWDAIGRSRFYRNMWPHLEPYVSQRFREYLLDRGGM